MKTKPDIQEAQRFMMAAGSNAIAAVAPAVAPSEAPVRITKTIRLDRATDLALKRAALERTVAGGVRVTESDLIEQAIRQHLNL